MHEKTVCPVAATVALIIAASSVTAAADDWNREHVFLQGTVATMHAEWSNVQVPDAYCRVVEGDLAGELVYIAANSDNMYVVDDAIDVKRSISAFTNNLDASAIGDLHRLDSTFGQVFWRGFTLASGGKHCAGFTATGK